MTITIEVQAIPADLCAKRPAGLSDDRLGQFHPFDVDDAAAPAADKVAVRIGARIKALKSGYRTDRVDHAVLLESGEIAVDRSEAQIRDLGLQLTVDPFGRRMASRIAQAL